MLTYGDHGQQDEACCTSLLRALGEVDERVHGGGGEDQTSTHEAHQSNVIGLNGIGGHNDKDADDAPEHVDECPPGEVGVVGLDVGDDGADECY